MRSATMLGVFVLALGLSGCGSSDEQVVLTDPQQSQTSRQVTPQPETSATLSQEVEPQCLVPTGISYWSVSDEQLLGRDGLPLAIEGYEFDSRSGETISVPLPGDPVHGGKLFQVFDSQAENETLHGCLDQGPLSFSAHSIEGAGQSFMDQFSVPGHAQVGDRIELIFNDSSATSVEYRVTSLKAVGKSVMATSDYIWSPTPNPVVIYTSYDPCPSTPEHHGSDAAMSPIDLPGSYDWSDPTRGTDQLCDSFDRATIFEVSVAIVAQRVSP